MSSDPSSAAPRAWLRSEQRVGSRAARPVALFGLLGTAMAVGQAWCAAMLLAGALTGRGAATPAAARWASRCWRCCARRCRSPPNRAAFNAGAAARRRLRTDALSRLLHAGPAQASHAAHRRADRHRGGSHRGAGRAVRALAAGRRCWRSPARCWWRWPRCSADPMAALVLAAVRAAGAGRDGRCRSRRGGGVAHQFLALARLQARFLDRVRGIATIVLYGQAEAEAQSLAAAADELRRRTMRVLRVAFLSSAALDLAAALAFVVLALRYGVDLLAGSTDASGHRAVRAAAGAGVLRPAARLRRRLPGPAACHRRRRGAGSICRPRRRRSRSARSAPSRRAASPWHSRTFISPGTPRAARR